jgi:hypothetical protein
MRLADIREEKSGQIRAFVPQVKPLYHLPPGNYFQSLDWVLA